MTMKEIHYDPYKYPEVHRLMEEIKKNPKLDALQQNEAMYAVIRLSKLSTALQRCFERDCNENPTQASEEHKQKKLRLVRKYVKDLPQGWGVEINSDPRGAAIGITGVGIYNTLGGLEAGWKI